MQVLTLAIIRHPFQIHSIHRLQIDLFDDVFTCASKFKQTGSGIWDPENQQTNRRTNNAAASLYFPALYYFFFYFFLLFLGTAHIVLTLRITDLLPWQLREGSVEIGRWRKSAPNCRQLSVIIVKFKQRVFSRAIIIITK